MFKYPCKGCEERKIGCHDKCKAFLEAKAKNEEERVAYQNEMLLKDFYVNRRFRMTNRNRHTSSFLKGHKK